MADTWKSNVMCRYFVNGICREGINCRYQHVAVSSNEIDDSSSSIIVQEEDVGNNVDQNSAAVNGICRFFKQGTCKFGGRCRFGHSNSNSPDEDDEANEEEGGEEEEEEYLRNNQSYNSNTVNSPSTSSSNCKNTKNSSSSSNIAKENPEDETKDDYLRAEEWVKAPEFVPSFLPPPSSASSSTCEDILSASGPTSTPISYAQALNPNGQTSNPASEPLCPYAEASGVCKKTNCTYLHGDICELCGRAALHPHNEEHRKKHTNACVKQHEVDMELSFAIQRSREKSCGVCFETIMEKSSREQRFGILPNCNHCFCLTCIRKWRQAKQFDNKIIRACPECRVSSDFVCPSMYWVDTKEEKEKLITDYKEALSTKDCKYFNKGRGKCPFGNKCFYLHALPDGTKTDVGPPQMILWDFLDERDSRWMYSIDDLEEIVAFFSDSEDSDWSEYELFFD